MLKTDRCVPQYDVGPLLPAGWPATAPQSGRQPGASPRASRHAGRGCPPAAGRGPARCRLGPAHCPASAADHGGDARARPAPPDRSPLGPLLRGKMRWVAADANRCDYARPTPRPTCAGPGSTEAGCGLEGTRSLAARRRAAALAFARQMTARRRHRSPTTRSPT